MMGNSEELNTNINITASESASGPLQSATSAAQQLSQAAAQTAQNFAHLQQAAATAATSVSQSMQQAARSSQQAAQQIQQAQQQINSGGGGASAGGFAQQMSAGLRSLQQQTATIGQSFQSLGPQLQAPFQGVSQQASALSRTFSGLGTALQQPFHLLGAAASSVQGSLQGVGSALTSALGPLLQGAGFALAIAGINGVGGALQAVVGTAIGFNSSLQLAVIALTSFTGSAGAALQEVKALQVLAANSPFEFQDVLVGARRFQSLGLSAGQTLTFLKDLSAVSGSFGLDTNQFSRAELAISQVGVKGKLTGEELRQMGNDGFQALHMIQLVTGQSMASINKDIEAGTFTASKFFGIIHDYAQRQDIQLLAQNINQSFAVASSNVHDLFQQLTSTATMPLFTAVTAGLQGLQATLQSTGAQQFAADVGATIQDLITKLQVVAPTFEKAFAQLQSGDFGAAASTALQGVGEAVNVLISSMFGAGENVAAEFAGGLLSGAADAIRGAADFAAGIVASFLVGQSPPKEGPLQGVDQGGRAVAEAWLQGFSSADFRSTAELQATVVRDALGNAGASITPAGGRADLQAAGQDMAKLKDVVLEAAGASRSLSDALRENQTESQALAREADVIKQSYEDQITPLERQLQSLRDQGSEASKLEEIEKRRRDLTLSAEEKIAQGDPVKRAQLQIQDDALARQEKGLQLQARQMTLDASGDTGKKKEADDKAIAAVRQQILDIDVKRGQVQAQMDGLVNVEALARIKLQKAQGEAVDNSNALQKAQAAYNKEVEENKLEKQIRDLKSAEEDANKPLQDRKKVLDEQRQGLQEQSQLFQQLKSDAGELLTQLRAVETERKTNAAAAKKDAKEHAGDTPLGAGLPEADVAGQAALAGNAIGASMLGGIQAKIREAGPSLIGGAIGAAVGGLTLGPLGIIAGGIFGAEFGKSLQEKIPDIGTILSDSLTTFKQALQGDWKPPGIDEWVNPFVLKVGNAGKSLHDFKAEITGPVESANWAKAGQNLQAFGTEWDKLVGRLSGGKGLQLVTEQDIKDISTLSAQLTGLAANVLDTFNTLGNAFSLFGTGMRATITSLQLLAKGDIFGAIQSEVAAGEAFRKIPEIIAAEQARAKERLTAQAPEVAAQARDTWSGYIKGVELALQPLGPTVADLIQPATIQVHGLATEFDSAAQTTARASGVLTTTASAQLQALATNAAAASADTTTSLSAIPASMASQQQPMQLASESVGSALSEPVAAAIQATIDDTTKQVPAVTTVVTSENTKMAAASGELGTNFQTPMGTALQAVIDEAGKQLPLVTAVVTTAQDPMHTAAFNLGTMLVNGLIESIAKGENPVLNAVDGLMAAVRGRLGGGWSGGPSGGGGGSGGGSASFAAYHPGQSGDVFFDGPPGSYRPQSGAPTAPGEVEQYLRMAAQRFSIDAATLMRVVLSEGGQQSLNGDVTRQSDVVTNGQREQSYGPLQLNINGGVGARAMAQGIDPRDPAQWRQAVDFALSVISQEGWGQWRGAAASGIGPREGIGVPGAGAALGGNVLASLKSPGAMLSGATAAPSSQFALTEQGLSAADAAAACGPYAAMLFANAVGRYPNAQETMALAAKVGWTQGAGMAGVGSELALMQSMGLNAVQQEATPGNINADLARGAPVAISTPAHYFEATGGTAEGGLNVGATGTALAGGKPVMTLDEISALGGGLQGILTLQGQVTAAQNTGLVAYQRLIPAQTAVAKGQQLIATTAAPLPEIQAQLTAGTQAVTAAETAGTAGGTHFATVLDGLYNSVANGATPLQTLQEQLVEIGAKAGVQGAAGDIQALVDGTESGAQAVENLATAMARTNPAMATLVKNYAAAGGAARASQKDTEKFALDVLNVMHAAQGQGLTSTVAHQNVSGIKADQGEKTGGGNNPPGGAKTGASGGAASPVAQPLAAINAQIDVGSAALPALTKGWTDATAAANLYLAIDLTPVNTAVQSQISIISGGLVGAWNSATEAVDKYIQEAQKAASLDVAGSHLEGAKEIKRTGLYQLHEGEEVLTRGQVRQASYGPPGSTGGHDGSYAGTRIGYVDQRTTVFNAVDPRQMISKYAREEGRLQRLRVRGSR